MLRVLAATAYPSSSPSPRVRIADFAPFAREQGVELLYRPTLTNEEYATILSGLSPSRKAVTIARAAARGWQHKPPEHDLLLVHRLRLINPLPAFDPPPRLDIYDFDDAIYLGSTTDANRRFQWVKQEGRRCLAYIRKARLTIAGNSFLADKAQQYAKRVEVVPSCVDPARQGVRNHRDTDVVTVGWIGSPTTSVYLRHVFPAFERLNAAGPRARLVLVGADRRLEAPWIDHHKWSLDTQSSELESFDIGIMPLPDTEWTRGKCAYKLLQYFAAGLPAVTSPVGVAQELAGDDRGILASSAEDWHAALERLIGDASERRERGAAARTFVERHYSYQRWAPELGAMLRTL